MEIPWIRGQRKNNHKKDQQSLPREQSKRGHAELCPVESEQGKSPKRAEKSKKLVQRPHLSFVKRKGDQIRESYRSGEISKSVK